MGVGGWGWVGGGWEELIIKLISAEAEAEALLVLAELGNTILSFIPCKNSISLSPRLLKFVGQYKLQKWLFL